MIYKVFVSLDGENFSDDYVIFRYYDDMQVTSVSPILGPTQGGTTVTVFGDHFNHQNVCNLTVKFGPNVVNASTYSVGSDGQVVF